MKKSKSEREQATAACEINPDAAFGGEKNPNFKPLPAEAQEAISDPLVEAVYLGDLNYMVQRPQLDRYGRTHTIVSLCPDGPLVAKAAAQLLQADVLHPPSIRHYQVFQRMLRKMVRTSRNYVFEAQGKRKMDRYGDEFVAYNGDSRLRYYSSTVAYVWQRERTRVSIFLQKSRVLLPLRTYTFDRKQIEDLATQFAATCREAGDLC